MNWTSEVVNFLENNCFHNNEKVLVRESDIAYQGLIDNKLEELTDKSIMPISVLDFGCGTGRQLEINDFQIKHKIHYIGYDKSEEMIKKAKSKYPEQAFYNSEPFALDSNIIDLLISNDVLQHTENFDKFKELLEEMLLISNNVICHCWYEEEEKYQKVTLENEKFHEFFVDPIKLEKYFKEQLKEYNFYIIRFPNEKPYKCLVFTLNLKENEAKEEPEFNAFAELIKGFSNELKETERTPVSDDNINSQIESLD